MSPRWRLFFHAPRSHFTLLPLWWSRARSSRDFFLLFDFHRLFEFPVANDDDDEWNGGEKRHVARLLLLLFGWLLFSFFFAVLLLRHTKRRQRILLTGLTLIWGNRGAEREKRWWNARVSGSTKNAFHPARQYETSSTVKTERLTEW